MTTSWLPFAVATMIGFALWSLLGKVALDHGASWQQLTLLFGVMTVVVAAAALLGSSAGWTTEGTLIGGASGLAGAIGLCTFYLAVDRGPASQVVPAIGVYPILVAVLAVVFLGDRLGPVQIAGICLSVTGVLLVGLGSS